MNHTLGTFRYDVDMLNAVEGVLKSGWLSPGPNVKAFEEQFAQLHNNSFGVFVNSGTDALRIALLALKEKYGWKDGDEVICPSVTFVATLNTILQAGLTPVLADVGMYDFNINPDNIKRRFIECANAGAKRPIRAIIPVHVAGNPADMPKLLNIAKEQNWKVIEDSCESVGVEGLAKADVTCFSFYMAHLVTTGVGGMAITNDPDLKTLMWSYANHGRRAAKGFVFDRIGYSARGTEFEAAIGLSQIPKLPDILEKRRRNAYLLCTNLLHLKKHLYVNYFRESANMFFPVVLQEDSPVNKWDLMAHLEKNGIETRELLPLINQPCYKGLVREQDSFCIAEWVNKNGFYIGCHQDITEERIIQTATVFEEFFASQGERIEEEGLPQDVSGKKENQG